MTSQVDVLEERLKSFLPQLQAESAILDRIVYKNKNQHRRCSYFQYLLKVRRDLKLLQSINLEELLDSCFIVITERKPKHKAHLLESLKKRKCESGRSNFLERLRGASRLLSEMVEPMLKSAIEISTLLARSFFMGFSLMILALLARLRVLIQQMLLDVVSVFNEVSSLAQKKQSIKIKQDGVEVFREYYPTMEEAVTLECVWRTDKFILVERSEKVGVRHEDGSLEKVQTSTPSIQYQSLEAFLDDDDLGAKKNDSNTDCSESISSVKRKSPESPSGLENNHTERAQVCSMPADIGDVVAISEDVTSKSGSGIATSPLPNPKFNSNKVAFVSVMKPCQSASDTAAVQVNESGSRSHNNEENLLFKLLNEEDPKGSIF